MLDQLVKLTYSVKVDAPLKQCIEDAIARSSKNDDALIEFQYRGITVRVNSTSSVALLVKDFGLAMNNMLQNPSVIGPGKSPGLWPSASGSQPL